MAKIKVIVAGSRGFRDYSLVEDTLDSLYRNTTELVIISGGARGADAMGERYAEERGVELIKVEANWEKFGKSAGYRRNIEMLEIANEVVVFWDGESKGSGHTIKIAKNKGLPTFVVRV